MTDEEPRGVNLDMNIRDHLADIICGDDAPGYYRTGWKLTQLFAVAGWPWAGDCEGGRRTWVIEQLKDRRANPQAMERLLLRLADPREYVDDQDARGSVVADLNTLLSLEGYELYYVPDGPRIRSRSRSLERLNSDAPVELEVDLTRVVQDSRFGAQLTRRLEEARICRDNGAHLASIIMLGSLLEGVLYDFARSQAAQGVSVDDNLQRLIKQAGDQGWVARDVTDYADVLRDHRNLVHPRKQDRGGHDPDADSVLIAWNVVVAALNDLAATKTRLSG